MNALWLRNGKGGKWDGRDEETEARGEKISIAFPESYCEQYLDFLIPNLLSLNCVLGIS